MATNLICITIVRKQTCTTACVGAFFHDESHAKHSSSLTFSSSHLFLISFPCHLSSDTVDCIVIIIIIIIIIINADSCRDLTPKQIYTEKFEKEKKRQYAEKVMEIEQGTSTPLVFTTTGGMADECVKHHSRLAKLNPNKKGESYSRAISWIRELKYLSPSYVLRYYA